MQCIYKNTIAKDVCVVYVHMYLGTYLCYYELKNIKQLDVIKLLRQSTLFKHSEENYYRRQTQPKHIRKL